MTHLFLLLPLHLSFSLNPFQSSFCSYYFPQIALARVSSDLRTPYPMVNWMSSSYLTSQQHSTLFSWFSFFLVSFATSLPSYPLSLGLNSLLQSFWSFLCLIHSCDYLIPLKNNLSANDTMTSKYIPLSSSSAFQICIPKCSLKFSTWVSRGHLQLTWRNLNSFSSFLPRFALPILSISSVARSFFQWLRSMILELSLTLLFLSHPSLTCMKACWFCLQNVFMSFSLEWKWSEDGQWGWLYDHSDVRNATELYTYR